MNKNHRYKHRPPTQKQGAIWNALTDEWQPLENFNHLPFPHISQSLFHMVKRGMAERVRLGQHRWVYRLPQPDPKVIDKRYNRD